MRQLKHVGEITLTLAAHRLGISWERAWRLCLTGKLQARKVDGRWVCTLTSVNEFARCLVGRGE